MMSAEKIVNLVSSRQTNCNRWHDPIFLNEKMNYFLLAHQQLSSSFASPMLRRVPSGAFFSLHNKQNFLFILCILLHVCYPSKMCFCNKSLEHYKLFTRFFSIYRISRNHSQASLYKRRKRWRVGALDRMMINGPPFCQIYWFPGG